MRSLPIGQFSVTQNRSKLSRSVLLYKVPGFDNDGPQHNKGGVMECGKVLARATRELFWLQITTDM